MIVHLTAEAEGDLEQIGDRTARDNPGRAVTFVDEIQRTCPDLAEFLVQFPLVPRCLWTDHDRKVSSTTSAYFANFIKTGNPNQKGLPVWLRASLDPAKIRRQVTDVEKRSTALPEQRRYVAWQIWNYDPELRG